ncbi:class I SAM-dependent methyltransferase [Thiomicrospira microaerophila]|uniref:class I SAM-dependent methyltransferase n=1 Tax=Thiomicrospira microaerophila TaxID=406020 RepID=UPI00200C9341|nr:class I SAM-dependent methyltransferase [Thiomicrospira microaerophila]
MFNNPEQAILKSWDTNAKAWTQAVRNREIESRNRVTNLAIVDAILAQDFQSMLDVGCGEGWLIRKIASTRPGAKSVDYMGIDGSEDLIRLAQKADPRHTYLNLTYQQLHLDTLPRKFDLIVCNFSLFGKESVDDLLIKLKNLLTENGRILIQTLHVADETTGWQAGSWQGFSERFTDPAPWYKRNHQAWLQTFEQAGLVVSKHRITQDPSSLQTCSVIFILIASNHSAECVEDWLDAEEARQ